VRWILFDAALAAALTIATFEGATSTDTRVMWRFIPPMIIALLIRRRFPLLAVLLAGTTALLRNLDPTANLEFIDLAVPLTIYTLASSARPLRPRRATVIGFAIALACVGLACTAQVLIANQRIDPKVADLRAEGMSPEEQLAVMKSKAAAAGEVQGDLRKPLMPDDMPSKRDFEPSPTMSDLVANAVARGITIMLVIALAFAIGDGVRSRREHLTTLEKRTADLEREQHQRVALSLAAERARITRELHDVVAHALSVMVVQAQGGAAALRRHPERTELALQNVITTGRTSLTEMRRLLHLVRQDPAGDPERAPQPGVDALPELIDVVRAAGTPVSFTVDGEPVPLPLAVDLSAYRIAQEALTNTIKHAGGTGMSARVRMAYRQDELELEVTDDGIGGEADTEAGNGLRGIAERVAVLGGELRIGPRDGGGFRVHATLPLRPKGMPA